MDEMDSSLSRSAADGILERIERMNSTAKEHQQLCLDIELHGKGIKNEVGHLMQQKTIADGDIRHLKAELEEEKTRTEALSQQSVEQILQIRAQENQNKAQEEENKGQWKCIKDLKEQIEVYEHEAKHKEQWLQQQAQRINFLEHKVNQQKQHIKDGRSLVCLDPLLNVQYVGSLLKWTSVVFWDILAIRAVLRRLGVWSAALVTTPWRRESSSLVSRTLN